MSIQGGAPLLIEAQYYKLHFVLHGTRIPYKQMKSLDRAENTPRCKLEAPQQ